MSRLNGHLIPLAGKQHNSVAVMVSAVNQNLTRRAAHMPRAAHFYRDARAVFHMFETQPDNRFQGSFAHRYFPVVNLLAVDADFFRGALKIPSVFHGYVYALVLRVPDFFSCFHINL